MPAESSGAARAWSFSRRFRTFLAFSAYPGYKARPGPADVLPGPGRNRPTQPGRHRPGVFCWWTGHGGSSPGRFRPQHDQTGPSGSRTAGKDACRRTAPADRKPHRDHTALQEEPDDHPRLRPVRPQCRTGADRRRTGLHRPHPHPAGGHSADCGRPRRDRPGPDRHRQDRGLRPAPAAPFGPATPRRAGACPRPHPRTGHSGGRGPRAVRPGRGRQGARPVRRPVLPAAAPQPARAGRGGGGHARPPARPDGTGQPGPGRGAHRGPRRGRRDAVHGLCRGHRVHPRPHPARASDPALLGHHLPAGAGAVQALPARPPNRVGHPGAAHRRLHRAALLPGQPPGQGGGTYPADRDGDHRQRPCLRPHPPGHR